MPNQLDGQGLIEAFFAALEHRALEQCEQALAQLQALAQIEPDYQPWGIYLAGVLVNEGDQDWAEAERIFSRLLQTDLQLPLRGRVLLALGRTYDYQGRWAEAIRVYEQSLPLFSQLNQPVDQAKTWKNMAISYNNGFTHSDFGPEALQQAVTYCQSALDLLQQVDPDSWLEGSIWNTLGLIHRNLGQWAEAVACYQRDMAICLILEDENGEGISSLNLGEIYQNWDQAYWPEALAAYQKALTLLRKSDNRSLEAETLANLGFFHQEMGEVEPALEYYRLAIGLIENIRAGISSEVGRAGFFATTADIYAHTVLLCLTAGHEATAFDYVERARSRAFLDILLARSPELPPKLEARPLTLAELQALLPPEALLLEYFTTGSPEVQLDQASRHRGVQRHRFPPGRVLLFAVTANELQVRNLEISPHDLSPHEFDSVVERHFLDPYIRRTLYNQLIAPVEALLKDKLRLYIAPHGLLHYIPFQVLIAPDGETLLRETGPQLIYAPSASLLFQRRASFSHSPSFSCLALGYNSEGRTRLDFAEEEAHRIAQLTKGRALVGPAPKKDILYRQAANYQILHLACHGGFEADSPLASFLHLAQGEKLTALDVLENLRLEKALVTLSACESGLSRVRRGDELIGLIRAFIYAGAVALVSTLWRVNDHASRILMERFYQEIQAGASLAEALKRAQLYVRHLTYQEALALLTPRASTTTPGDDSLPSNLPNFEAQPVLARPGLTLSEATAYLRGAASRGKSSAGEMSLDESVEEEVFRDPYYWAPFILIGD